MGISRGRLENRIIIAFIIVALSPLLISFSISTHIVRQKLEKEIKTRFSKASEVLKERMEELERKAVITGKILLKEPKFIELFLAKDAVRMKEFLTEFKKEFPVDIILVREAEKSKPGPHIFRIETEGWKGLVAGGVVPVILGGEDRGRVILGYVLGNKFTQFLSHSLGMEVKVFNFSGPFPADLKDLEISTKAREHLGKGEEYYETRGKIGGHPYFLYLIPILGEEKKILGLTILALPKTFTFQSVILRFLPPFLFLWFFISAALGYFLARGIMKPIKEFTQGAKAIAQGNLDQFIPVRTKDEIGRLAQAFNTMAKELKKMREIEEVLRRNERLVTLGEIAAGVAHEVGNPLGIIKNSAQMLMENKLSPAEGKELLQFIVEESERLERVIQNLLHFVKFPKPKKREVEVKELMERVLLILQGEFNSRNIKVVKKFPEYDCKMIADPDQFHQMFLNLILNSLDAMPKGGILTLEIYSENQKIEICIKDTGKGIPKEYRDKIFKPFFTTREGGTGLGLSIVSTIVNSHDGKIRVESEEGKGTAFYLIFPKEEKEWPEF